MPPSQLWLPRRRLPVSPSTSFAHAPHPLDNPGLGATQAEKE
jgi:hypothetical protein